MNMTTKANQRNDFALLLIVLSWVNKWNFCLNFFMNKKVKLYDKGDKMIEIKNHNAGSYED